MISGVLFDLGGVFYIGDRVLPGAFEALLSLRAARIPVRFLTNTTRSSARQILQRLDAMGLPVPPEHLFTPALAARHHLRSHDLRPHLLVHPALVDDFADLPRQPPNAVLIGDVGPGFGYEALNGAFRLLMQGMPLLALGRNRYFQDADGPCLDVGPMVAALEYAARCEALVLGKPSPAFFQAAVASMGLEPASVVMVGDDAESDVLGAVDAGLRGILVRTGKYRPGDDASVLARGGRCFDTLDAVIDAVL